MGNDQGAKPILGTKYTRGIDTRDDDYDDVDRMFLRVSIFETATEEPLWTGVRQAKYVNDSLVLSSEEISKYVNSFLNEIISS